MNRHKTLLGLIVVATIAISLGLIMVQGKAKEYDYEISMDRILPIVERNRTRFLVRDNQEEIIDRVVSDLVNESYDIIQENIDLVIAEVQGEEESLVEDLDEGVYEEIAEDVYEEIASHKPEQANRGGIGESRRLAPELSQHLNKYVLDVVNSYDYKSGNYPYLLNNDFENYNGVTEDIYYRGDLLLKAHPSGGKYSHCTGITFEVFFKAMQNRNKAYGIDINDFNGMTKDELFDFMLIWYVAAGHKEQSNLAVAIEKYGLGHIITNLEDAAPGDFIDLSRENNSGHAVVFLDWIRDPNNKIIGLKHWSSQGSTNGISHKEEYFNLRDSNGQKYGNVIIDSLYIARVNPISEYK